MVLYHTTTVEDMRQRLSQRRLGKRHGKRGGGRCGDNNDCNEGRWVVDMAAASVGLSVSTIVRMKSRA